LAEKIRRYREARQKAGLDPASGKVTLMLHTFVHRDAGYAQQLVREPFLEYIRSSLDAHKTAFAGGDQIKAEDLNKMVEFSYERYCREASLIGDPAGCFEMVTKCREIGVDEIACLLDFGADPDSILGSLSYLDELRMLCEVSARGDLEPSGSQVLVGANGSGRSSEDEPVGHFLSTDWIEEPSLQQEIKPAKTLLFVHCGSTELEEPLRAALGEPSSFSIAIGTTNRSLGSAKWEVDVSSAEAFVACLSEMPRPDFVCFMGSRDCDGDQVARVKEAEELGVISLMRLVQSMDARGWLTMPLRLRVITTGVYSICGESVDSYFAGLSGMSGSLRKEYPYLDIEALDVEQQDLTDVLQVSQLACLIAGGAGERINEKRGIRGGHRYRCRLSIVRPAGCDVSRFRERGVYLVIGGAGHAGTEVSLYLARKYQGRVVWIGRRSHDSAIEARIGRVRAAGGEAVYLRGAAEDRQTLRQAIGLAEHQYGALHGVIHSAFVFQDEKLNRLNASLAKEILAAKTGSAAALCDCMQGLPLDFLLFLNSAQSFFNEGRRAVYAAACSFIDAYASTIEQRVGFPVHVVNWGFWAHSFSSAIQSTMRQAGLGVIQPEDGMHVIETVLSRGIRQMAYVHANQQALVRMAIDPTEEVTYSEDRRELLDEAHALLTTKLFD
jgi:NAD(P)-dependent dehydrogenase (short-subunit alcohol dehydrogenase family)